MGELKGTADEIKTDLLWVAQESLRSNLVHGTAGNFSARLPDRPIVLRRESQVGHGARGVSRSVGLSADTLAFLAFHTGLTATGGD